MKLIISLATVVILLTSCSDLDVEELAFRKVLEYELIDLCGEDLKCIEAVENQIKQCMVSSDWRKFLNNQESEQELKIFTDKFYSCIVDSEGNPYFEIP